MRARRLGVIASITILAAVAMAAPAYAADPTDVAKNADQMWAAIGGTAAALILGFIGFKVLPGRRLGEILGGCAIGFLAVACIVASPAIIKFIDDTVTKLLA